jgi:hypothetical protein
MFIHPHLTRQSRPHRLTHVHCCEPYLLLTVLCQSIQHLEWTLTHSVNNDSTLPVKCIITFTLAKPFSIKWSIKILNCFEFINDEQLIVYFDRPELLLSHKLYTRMLLMLALFSLVQFLGRSNY